MYQKQNFRRQNYRGGYIKATIAMRIMTEVGVGLEKGNVKVILEGMIEVAVVDQHQDQE